MDVENSSFRVRTGEERRRVPRDTDRRLASGKTRRAPRTNPGTLSVTVSIGIAESQPKMAAEDAIQLADKALYRAKESGRNRIVITAPQPRPRRQGKRRPASL
jgi:diguanylate cyclase (GGDEF)-like protein